MTSAIVNEPDDEICGAKFNNSSTQTTTLILGSVFTFLALAYR